MGSWQAGVVAVVIVASGLLGRLVLSAIKRALSVKDWSAMVKSHDGVLDRTASVTFAAPIFCHITGYFFAA